TWSVDARVADPQRGNLVLTIVFATIGVLAALTAIVYRRPVYRWLRRSRLHQATPALAGITMMLADGPHSATWWIAFALLFVMAAVSSTTLTTLAAIGAAAAYLGGTLIYGSALIYQGDTGNLIGAGMLIINALGARAIAETFGQFVLRLHRLESQLAQPQAPRKIDLAAPPPSGTPQPATATQHRRRGNVVREARTLLTTRQLEAVLLARDGLHQHEIADCLAISQRQVERLLEQ